MSARFRVSYLVTSSALATLTLLLSSAGCSSNGGGNTGGSGGGLPPGTGGAPLGTGGVTSSGGGGPLGSGGTIGTGGGASSGGAAAGGTTGSGGDTASGGAPGSGGTSSGIQGYNPDFKEFVGEDCELPEPELLSSADHMLPDPFLMSDGTRMSSVSQWACQRAWLKKNIEKFIHGTKPGRPEVVTGSVSGTSISVHVEEGGQSADFSVPITLPGGASGPVPGMFQANADTTMANFFRTEGLATMVYSHASAESAFNAVYGGGGGVSNQIKWAWFVSRAIDVLVDEKAAGNNDIIDPTALGTTGCSFAGKSAFTVGAFDERIALGLPVESGTGGLASYRVTLDNDLGPNTPDSDKNPEQLSEICNGSNSGWFSQDLCSDYVSQLNSLPVDAHFAAAMYAPRGFATLDNNRIGHLGPVAQFTAVSAAAEVYKALGVETSIGYHGGNDTDPHGHCSWNPSQEETAHKAIDAFLKKTAAPANFMEPKLKDGTNQAVTWSLDEYISWTTPALD